MPDDEQAVTPNHMPCLLREKAAALPSAASLLAALLLGEGERD